MGQLEAGENMTSCWVLCRERNLTFNFEGGSSQTSTFPKETPCRCRSHRIRIQETLEARDKIDRVFVSFVFVIVCERKTCKV